MSSTSAASAVLLGSQTPSLAVVPEYDYSDAEDASFLASGYGLTPDEWQRTVLTGWLGRRSDGRWSSSRRGLAVARQNGKNGVLEIDELFKMVALGRRILHTAHEVKTCRKAFVRLASFFENERQYPELAALVKEIRRTNGQEAIVLTNGGSAEFIARSKSSGRGFTVDDLVMDEAQELTEDALAALLPTVSAAPSGNPQVTMTGTPPSSEAKGEAFIRTRGQAQEGGDGRLAWYEWANPANVDINDLEAIAAANPALGIRISLETIEDERAQMAEDEFARERLGVWDAMSSQSVIEADTWAALADPKSKPGDHVAFALHVPPEGKRAALARAGFRADDRVHGEVDVKTGTRWAVDRLKELGKRNAIVALDASGLAASYMAELIEAGVKVVPYSTRDVVRACGSFVTKAEEDGLRHLGQPELAIAVDGARKRRVGEAWLWARRDTSVDISPLQALTLAVYGLKEERPKRKSGRAMAV